MSERMWTCSGCVFAEMKDNKQIGCKVNRLDYLIDKIEGKNIYLDNDKIYAQFEKFCNSYRPAQWLSDENLNSKDMYEVLEEELQPPIGYVIVFNDDLKALEKTLNSLTDPKYVIIVNEKVEYNEEIFEICDRYFKDTECSYKLIQLISKIEYKKKLDESFKHCKNGWISLITAGYEFPKYFVEKIHKYVNHKMKKLAVVYDKDKKKLMVQAKVYKFLNGNMPKILEDGSIDHNDFYERLSKVKVEDEGIIQTWENFFDD